MPDPIIADPAVETPPVQAAETSEAPDLTSEVDKWKALSRKNEQRAKENEAAAKKLAEIEDANKTETERLIARAEAAEKALAAREAAEATAQLVKDVANEKGFADRGISVDALRGGTREELEAHADQLLALIPVKPKAPSADGQGNTGKPIESAPQITSREHLKSMSPADIDAARQDGRLDSLLGK